jgi:hypothetical protein
LCFLDVRVIPPELNIGQRGLEDADIKALTL